jgi:2-dehydro-3-deoxygalactonokinase
MHDTLLGVDWGTTNRRAYLVDREGRCLRRHADGQGLLAVRGGFAESLAALRGAMDVGDEVPVLMSGMVGSASGWQEAPYLDIDTPLEGLPESLMPVKGHAHTAIVPGYRTRGAMVDVMRGEEVQLLGAIALGVRSGAVVLPGTHSKWVHMRGGAIERFSTFMTGEVFAMLGTAGTLSALLADAPHDEGGFSAGLDAARLGRPLTQSLFGARARVVTGEMAPAAARSYVSGLLIGAEFAAAEGGHDLPDGARTVHIIGSHGLAERYAQAARHAGLVPVALDPDAVYIAALQRFFDKV